MRSRLQKTNAEYYYCNFVSKIFHSIMVYDSLPPTLLLQDWYSRQQIHATFPEHGQNNRS